MTVTVTKPQATLRELLAGLKKRTGLFGEQILRAENATDFYSVIGNNRNVLINGSMDIWQRGTSWAGGSDNDLYTADRWHVQRYAANGMSITQQPATDIGFNYCLRIGRVSGNTDTTSYFLNQPVEGLNSKRCLGKWVTFSFWIRTGSAHQPGYGFNSAICYHTNASYPNDGMYYTNFRQASGSSASIELDLKHKVGTTWKRFEQTAFIPANAVQVGVAFGSGGTGTATSNDYFEVTGLQLEIGTTATPFEYRQIGQELALCQRYYWKAHGLPPYEYPSVGAGGYINSTYFSAFIPYPVQMRSTPTFLIGTNLFVNTVSYPAISSIAANYSNKYSGRVDFNTATSTAGFGGNLGLNADTASFIAASAEL